MTVSKQFTLAYWSNLQSPSETHPHTSSLGRVLKGVTMCAIHGNILSDLYRISELKYMIAVMSFLLTTVTLTNLAS